MNMSLVQKHRADLAASREVAGLLSNGLKAEADAVVCVGEIDEILGLLGRLLQEAIPAQERCESFCKEGLEVANEATLSGVPVSPETLANLEALAERVRKNRAVIDDAIPALTYCRASMKMRGLLHEPEVVEAPGDNLLFYSRHTPEERAEAEKNLPPILSELAVRRSLATLDNVIGLHRGSIAPPDDPETAPEPEIPAPDGDEGDDEADNPDGAHDEDPEPPALQAPEVPVRQAGSLDEVMASLAGQLNVSLDPDPVNEREFADETEQAPPPQQVEEAHAPSTVPVEAPEPMAPALVDDGWPNCVPDWAK